MSTDLPVVYRAADIGEADIVAAWLEENGIQAFVRDEHASVTMPTSLIVAPRGIPICVAPADEAGAKALMEEHQEEIKRRHSALGTVESKCEECGKQSTFPATQMGTVQVCPHCKADMDV